MKATDQYLLTKHASAFGRLAGLAPLAAFAPVSAISRYQDDEGLKGVGAGLTTDINRGIGGLSGMVALKGLQSHINMPESAAARAAMLLAAIGGGAAAGHFRGKSIGEQMFHPGTMMDRLKHSWQNF